MKKPLNRQKPLIRAITRAERALREIYRLDLELEAAQCLVDPRLARQLLHDGAPRTGLLVVEEDDEALLGLYFDDRDCDRSDTVVEETSHLLCVAWHATQQRRVSKRTQGGFQCPPDTFRQ